ncbi:hypothetical protein [Niallia sp. 03190]
MHIKEEKHCETKEIDIKSLINQYLGEKITTDFINKIKGTS